jgi:hypothetical protein
MECLPDGDENDPMATPNSYSDADVMAPPSQHAPTSTKSRSTSTSTAAKVGSSSRILRITVASASARRNFYSESSRKSGLTSIDEISGN